MCQAENTNDGSPWWTNPKNLVIRKRGLKESQTNGFYTIETPDGSSTTYEVICTILRTSLDFQTSVEGFPKYSKNIHTMVSVHHKVIPKIYKKWYQNIHVVVKKYSIHKFLHKCTIKYLASAWRSNKCPKYSRTG